MITISFESIESTFDLQRKSRHRSKYKKREKKIKTKKREQEFLLKNVLA